MAKTDQERFTYGRWQAGRLSFPMPGAADPADHWVVDLVVVEEDEDEDCRAVGRYRPALDMKPDLGLVMERAIREPNEGRPHLPAIVRVSDEALAREIHARRPEVRVVIGPTPLIESLGREIGEGVVPEEDDVEHWTWVDNGVKADQVARLFAATDGAIETIGGGLLEPGQLLEVRAPSIGLERAWAHVMIEDSVIGGYIVSLAIAPDRAAREAWDDDESTDSEILVFLLERDDLPLEAWREIQQHGWQTRRNLYPHVVAGGEDERFADPKEIEIAIAVLEALPRAFDPFAEDPTPGKARAFTLSAGGEGTVTATEEMVYFDDDDDDDVDFDDDDGDEDDDDSDGDDGVDVLTELDDDDLAFLELDAKKPWAAAPPPAPATVRVAAKPGRNDPCWCGSGQKYKKCHLDQDQGR